MAKHSNEINSNVQGRRIRGKKSSGKPLWVAHRRLSKFLSLNNQNNITYKFDQEHTQEHDQEHTQEHDQEHTQEHTQNTRKFEINKQEAGISKINLDFHQNQENFNYEDSGKPRKKSAKRTIEAANDLKEDSKTSFSRDEKESDKQARNDRKKTNEEVDSKKNKNIAKSTQIRSNSVPKYVNPNDSKTVKIKSGNEIKYYTIKEAKKSEYKQINQQINEFKNKNQGIGQQKIEDAAGSPENWTQEIKNAVQKAQEALQSNLNDQSKALEQSSEGKNFNLAERLARLNSETIDANSKIVPMIARSEEETAKTRKEEDDKKKEEENKKEKEEKETKLKKEQDDKTNLQNTYRNIKIQEYFRQQFPQNGGSGLLGIIVGAVSGGLSLFASATGAATDFLRDLCSPVFSNIFGNLLSTDERENEGVDHSVDGRQLMAQIDQYRAKSGSNVFMVNGNVIRLDILKNAINEYMEGTGKTLIGFETLRSDARQNTYDRNVKAIARQMTKESVTNRERDQSLGKNATRQAINYNTLYRKARSNSVQPKHNPILLPKEIQKTMGDHPHTM